MMNKNLAGLLGFILSFLSFNAAHAQVLLTINDSIPSATVITATDNLLTTSVDAQTISNGVDLLLFFGSGSSFPPYQVVSTSLTPGDGTSSSSFDSAINDNLTYITHQSGQFVDLSLYGSNAGQSMSFTSGDAAFDGSITLNLSGYDLPGPTFGTIVTGFSLTSPNNVAIGQYEVVAAPEPSTWILMLGVIGTLAFLRRSSLQV